MLYERVDLYKECGVGRGAHKKGYLVTYIPHQTVELKRKIRPAVVICPGGGYEFWSEREGEPVALRFVNAGYAAFVLDYDLNTAYPEPLFQACMAIKYLRERAKTLGIDGNHIATVGFSAGGHLAASFATLYGEEPFASRLGVSAQTLRPDAAVLSYPVITMEEGATHGGTRRIITGGDPALVKKLSLENAVTKNSSPAFIWHTATDDCVPVENAFRLAAAYRRCGVPYELHVFERGVHGLSLADIDVCDEGNVEGERAEIAVWFSLALNFLKGRGFAVKSAKE